LLVVVEVVKVFSSSWYQTCLILIFAVNFVFSPLSLMAEESFLASFEIQRSTVEALEILGQEYEYTQNSSAPDRPNSPPSVELSFPITEQPGNEWIEIEFSPHSIYRRGHFQNTETPTYHFRGVPKAGVKGDFSRISVYRINGKQPQVRGWIRFEGKDYAITNSSGAPSAYFGSDERPFHLEDDAVSLIVSNVENEALQETLRNCRVLEAKERFRAAVGTNTLLPPSQPTEGLREIEVGVDLDYQYYQNFGASSLAESASIMNSVDGIYQSELNLRIKLVEQHLWSSANDPYEDSLSEDPADFADMIYDFRENNLLMKADYRHLFSGRQIPGGTLGLAFLGRTCDDYSNVGVSTLYGSHTSQVVVVAHELAHSLGAQHSTESPDSCVSDDIMCWYEQPTATKFYPAAKSEIETWIALYGSCITHQEAPLYELRGRVTDGQSGAALSDVLVTPSSGKSVLTDSNGRYHLTGLTTGALRITPTRSGYSFSPTYTEVYLTADQTGVNFTATRLASPPVVTSHPRSLTTYRQLPVSFTCNGTGDSFSWQVNLGTGWQDIPNEVGKTLSLGAAIILMNGTTFRCKTSNSAGSSYSNSATLLVVTPPRLSASRSLVWAGEEITLDLSEAPLPGHVVVWKSTRSFDFSGDSTILATTTTTQFPVTIEESTLFGTEFRQIGSEEGTSTQSVYVRTAAPLEVSLAPLNDTSETKDPVQLRATASGGVAPLTYRFFWSWPGREGNLLTESDSSRYAYMVHPEDLGNTYEYHVVVTDSTGVSAKSTRVKTRLVGPPHLIEQINDVSVNAGEDATFVFRATTAGGKEVYWYINGVLIDSPYSGSTHVVSAATVADSGTTVQAHVKDSESGLSLFSRVATLTVIGASAGPRIVTQPRPTSALAGKPVSLSVEATGQTQTRSKEAELSYQWFQNGIAIPGETSKNFRIRRLRPELQGAYFVRVTDHEGLSVQSDNADVTIQGAKVTTLVRPKKMRVAKPAGGTLRTTCRVRIKPAKQRRALLAGSHYELLIDGHVVRSQEGKKGKRFALTLLSSYNDSRLTCAFIDGKGVRHESASSVKLLVK
jgi:hypothetical protein